MAFRLVLVVGLVEPSPPRAALPRRVHSGARFRGFSAGEETLAAVRKAQGLFEEAVQLSNRVCVISPRPGRIERILEIDLPWPRDLAVKNSAAFTAYVREIQEIFHGYGVI